MNGSNGEWMDGWTEKWTNRYEDGVLAAQIGGNIP